MMHRQPGLSPKEISVLVSIRDQGQTRKTVAHEVGTLPSELTRLVKSLESKGLVTVQRHGMSSSMSLTSLKHAVVLRRTLNEFSHMKLDKILSFASLPILSSLATTPRATRHEIMSSSGVSARTLQTTLKRLGELGIVRTPSRGTYEISSRFELFADFAREFTEYTNHREATEFCPDSIVVWQRGRESIIRTRREKESDDFKMTAFSTFENYHVPLFTSWNYYYHPSGEWRRTLDEVLLQSLLIRPRSTRENTAILMLWQRNDLGRRADRLRERARWYGLEEELETIASYFEDPERNRPPGFPRMSELMQKLGVQGR